MLCHTECDLDRLWITWLKEILLDTIEHVGLLSVDQLLHHHVSEVEDGEEVKERADAPANGRVPRLAIRESQLWLLCKHVNLKWSL